MWTSFPCHTACSPVDQWEYSLRPCLLLAGVLARSELTNQRLSCCCHNNTFLIGRHGGSTNNIFSPSFPFVRWIVTLWNNAHQLLGHKSCHRWCLWTWMLSYRPDISSVTVPRHLKSFAHSRNPPLSSHYLCVASRNQVVGLAHKKRALICLKNSFFSLPRGERYKFMTFSTRILHHLWLFYTSNACSACRF